MSPAPDRDRAREELVPEADPRAAYWEDPERVERFSGRDPDLRLTSLLTSYPDPSGTRVLDLGCAGGRNTRLLVDHRFDVIAVDIAGAMVQRTREAIAPFVGPDAARRRIRVGRMDDLGFLAAGSIDLVVALGIYHQARDEDELDRSLSETARVLAVGGRVLVAVFGPGTRLGGRKFEPVASTRYVHRDAEMGTVCLLGAEDLDREMARHGLAPEAPTETVIREDDDSCRVVANGLFRKS